MARFCSECGHPVDVGSNFCIGCGTSFTGKSPAKAEWEKKRDRVMGGGKLSTGKSLKRISLFLIAALLGGWVYLNLPEVGNPIIKDSPVVTDPVSYGTAGEEMSNVPAKVENGFIVLPLDLLKEKRFVRFMYGDPELGLPLLAYITNEGKVVTAVSLCEPCNSTRFHMKGDEIVCNACGSTWKLNNLEAVSGSCGKYPPDAIPNTIDGNSIRIDEQYASRWRRRV